MISVYAYLNIKWVKNMIVTDIIIYFIIFMVGAFFGSFYSLAIYRMPLGEKVIQKHPFCSKCKHNLGVMELIPVFSYIFSRGKCKHCKEKINPRYFIFEICSGICFVLLTMSFKTIFLEFDIVKTMQLLFLLLYISTLVIIAGIDKEKRMIQKSVILLGLIITSIYIIYLYIVEHTNIYRYIIYLIMMLVLVLVDTYLLTKKAQNNYYIQILILCMYIILFSTEDIFILTAIYTILEIIIYIIIKKISNRKKRKVIDKKNKQLIPVGYYLCITNIILIIIMEGF